jgi:O-6-methylguanine DNA methyltransferase
MSTQRIEHALAGLGETAPAGFDRQVLVAVDLADRGVRRQLPGVGELLLTFNRRGVSATEFTGHGTFEDLEARLGRPVLPVDDADVPPRLRVGLDRALDTGRVGRLPLDLRGISPFRVAALAKAAEIPPGEVRPYAWVAREIGRPGAVRAVGTAMATNRIPVFLPCHRVVPSDGSLGAYGGGPERKRALLEAEGLDVDRLVEVAGRGVRFVGSDTTGVFCLPTCRHARRITARHRVELHDPVEARARGFRPCTVCRPA